MPSGIVDHLLIWQQEGKAMFSLVIEIEQTIIKINNSL